MTSSLSNVDHSAITSAMRRAGVIALGELFEAGVGSEFLVCQVFQAMTEAAEKDARLLEQEMSQTDLARRIATLEDTLREEIDARLRAEHDFRHRISYIERNCLLPMLGQQMRVSWPSRLRGWLGLSRCSMQKAPSKNRAKCNPSGCV